MSTRSVWRIPVMLGLAPLVLACAACGGRAAAPVELVRSTDALMTCDHLAAEQRANVSRLQELAEESGASDANSVGLALIAGPIWLDGRQGASKEAKAVAARSERVAALIAEKGCVEENASSTSRPPS